MHHTACFYRHLNLRNSLTTFNHPIDISEYLTTELNQKKSNIYRDASMGINFIVRLVLSNTFPAN